MRRILLAIAILFASIAGATDFAAMSDAELKTELLNTMRTCQAHDPGNVLARQATQARLTEIVDEIERRAGRPQPAIRELAEHSCQP